MASALPYITTGATAIGTLTDVYKAIKPTGQNMQPAEPISVGSRPGQGITNPYIKTSLLSNPYLSTKYKTPEGQIRGK